MQKKSIATAVAALAALAVSAAPVEGTTVQVAGREVYVHNPNYDKSKIAKPWPTGKDYPRHPKAIVTANELIRSHVPDECYLGSVCTPWGHIKPELEDYWSSGINQLADYMDGKGL